MEKLTQKELRHTRRVLRVLREAKERLFELAGDAASSNTFPKTTLKAYVEVSEAMNRAEIRINARDARVV